MPDSDSLPLILACTDGSAYAPSVYDHAAWAATRWPASVSVLHAHDENGGPASPALLATARHHLARAGTTRIEVESFSGSLDSALSTEAGTRRLVILGKRGERADLVRTEIGRNVESAVRGNDGPFLVASRQFRAINRALLAYDGSKSADRAVDFLVQEPLLRGVSLHVIAAHAERPELAGQLAQACARLSSAGYAIKSELSPDYPDIAIAATARRLEVDLLIMGAFGHSKVRNFVMGSTTKTMLRALPISVLLFRAP